MFNTLIEKLKARLNPSKEKIEGTEGKQQPRVRIERGTTKLIVPHENNEIAFAYHLFGPGTYHEVEKQILEQGYRIPTAEETVSLLYAAYFSGMEYRREFESIRRIITNDKLWIFNKNLWTEKGDYVVQDPEAKGISKKLDKNSLEKMLVDRIYIGEDVKVEYILEGQIF